MQPSETDKSPLLPVMVRNPVCAVGVGDVNLNHNQLGRIAEGERLDMFVHDNCAVVGR